MQFFQCINLSPGFVDRFEHVEICHVSFPERLQVCIQQWMFQGTYPAPFTFQDKPYLIADWIITITSITEGEIP